MDPIRQIDQAHEAGNHDEALRLLLELDAQARRDDPTLPLPPFIVLFAWGQLAAVYQPARLALQALRDEHVARLESGDIHTGQRDFAGKPHSRFPDIAMFNDKLDDSRSTYAVFVYLSRHLPDVAQ
jgi:hypothetical protein